MPAPGVVFHYTTDTSGDCYISFLLDAEELARFTYHISDATVSITDRPQGILPEKTFSGFLNEARNFIGNIQTRYNPSKLLSGGYKVKLDIDHDPRRVVLNNLQQGLHYRVEWEDHNITLFPRNAHTFAWGDFLQFINWHETLMQYVSA